jgi:hypothetical protein
LQNNVKSATNPTDGMPPTALHQQPPDTTMSPYNIPVNSAAAAGAPTGGAGAGDEFNHQAVRWEEPKAGGGTGC